MRWRYCLAVLAGLAAFAGQAQAAPNEPIAKRDAVRMISALQDWRTPVADNLALLERLIESGSLDQVVTAKDSQVSVALRRRYIRLLFESGLLDRGIAETEALTPEQRSLVYGEAPSFDKVRIGGSTVEFWERHDLDFVDLAAALALTGRTDEAKAMLERAAPLEAARAFLSCAYDQPDGQRCAVPSGVNERVLLLDRLLFGPDGDPYPLAEVIFGGWSLMDEAPESALWTDVTCRLFTGPRLGSICKGSQDRILWRTGGIGPVAVAPAALQQLAQHTVRREAYAAELRAVALRYGWTPGDTKPPPAKERPERFPLKTLSPSLRRPPSIEDSPFGGLEILPAEFRPVRMEQDGKRIVVISRADHYDRNYGVGGGFWVHLSEDDGETWSAPLYTGLSDGAPYVVLPNSGLPIFHGDELQVAVDIDEVIPSHTRPAYGRQGRSEKNFFLTIPIATLSRDTDGDGMTDLAEEHLGLRPDQADRFDRPLGPSGAAPECPAEEAASEQSRQRVVDAIFAWERAQAARWTMPHEEGLEIPKLAAALAAKSNMYPVRFLRGEPADYACLAFDRLALVYDGLDLARLEEEMPDPETLYIGRFVHNEAADRGYIIWAYPAGSSFFRARLVAGQWQVEYMGGWST